MSDDSESHENAKAKLKEPDYISSNFGFLLLVLKHHKILFDRILHNQEFVEVLKIIRIRHTNR